MNWGEEDPYQAFSGLGCGWASKIWQFNGREPKPGHDYDRHRKIIRWGKELRDLRMTGDVYPLVEGPEEDMRKWNGVQIHDPVSNCGMVQLFRRRNSPEPEFRLNLAGLEPGATYEAESFEGGAKRLSGRELATLAVTLDSPRSFLILRYRRIG